MSKFVWEPPEKLILSSEMPPDVFEELRKKGRLKERKWPEDFRGFGSNVKPKKQR